MKESDVLEQSFRLISSLEGLRNEAYYDVSRWSIGYGTISFKGEKITTQEAQNRARDYIQNDVNYLRSIGWDLSDLFTIPLLSKGYQYGRGIYSRYLKLSPEERVKEFNDADDYQYSSRRQKELNFYYSLKNKQSTGFVLLIIFVLLLVNYKKILQWLK